MQCLWQIFIPRHAFTRFPTRLTMSAAAAAATQGISEKSRTTTTLSFGIMIRW
jgi:hypothetical protein